MAITQSVARVGVPDRATALEREHDALERLYILRGQIDYVRAQLSSARPNPNVLEYQITLPRLERSYLHTVRDYEAARAQRATASSSEARRASSPNDSTAVIPSLIGAGLLVVLFVVMATTALRRAQRGRPAPPMLDERWQQVEQTAAELTVEVSRLQETQRAAEAAWLPRTKPLIDDTHSVS